jgi:RTX calcium-binding nonapeptide repeat (4 copies)
MFSMPAMFSTPSRKAAVGVLAAVALVAVAVFALPTGAAPAGKIVVYGAHSGSTLTLHKKHGRIVVRGRMADRRPRGCHFKRGHRVAVCRPRHKQLIEIKMGPSGDLVRVADKMPMPVVVYLGAGSDKFIGNAERDLCFPGGARRNRCVGRGNNDVCITGPRNSDCVGGGGNDFCRHGTGSDGCWGGPGRDICIMGPGQDGCHGGPGNDRLYGGAQPDQLYGGRGRDYCNGGPGWGKSHSCDAGPRR